MKNRILIILFFSFWIMNPVIGQINTKKINVSGRITDTNGNPLQEVVFMIDGVKLDTYVNNKGFYKIRIPENTKTIMVFSVKNGLKEHQFKGETNINFELFADSQTANKDNSGSEKNINIGYGTTNKSELTSSVGVVTSNKNSFYRNIYDMIAGKVPGVTVTGNRIIIRGISTVNASTDPLLVVDGQIVQNINDIPPSEVDNISILKGSEAAMYGSRGGNGVILITLKKAKKGN